MAFLWDCLPRSWSCLACIMAMETLCSLAVVFTWLFGNINEIIENLYNIDTCDFACFREVSQQMAVLRLVCVAAYAVTALSALVAMFGFLSGCYKLVLQHVIFSSLRLFFTITVSCYLLTLTFPFARPFRLTVAGLLLSTAANSVSLALIAKGFATERWRHTQEESGVTEPLERPLSAHRWARWRVRKLSRQLYGATLRKPETSSEAETMAGRQVYGATLPSEAETMVGGYCSPEPEPSEEFFDRRVSACS